VSSAILYGAIVVIWAGVLIPRWLRRESSTETSEAVADVETVNPVTEQEQELPARGSVESSGPEDSPVSPDVPAPPPPPPPLRRDEERARVLGARRRLLGMLLALATGAAILAVTQLAAWWVVLPPAVMLLGYLALLREASKADAERRSAHQTRTASPATVSSDSVPETVPVTVPAPDAEVIDITGRVGDEFYDQYADAKLRAVGD
jgi:hypothetical protein